MFNGALYRSADNIKSIILSKKYSNKIEMAYSTKYIFIKSTTVYVPSSEFGGAPVPTTALEKKLTTLPTLWLTVCVRRRVGLTKSNRSSNHPSKTEWLSKVVYRDLFYQLGTCSRRSNP